MSNKTLPPNQAQFVRKHEKLLTKISKNHDTFKVSEIRDYDGYSKKFLHKAKHRDVIKLEQRSLRHGNTWSLPNNIRTFLTERDK